jgi:hypothetical protein
MGVAPRRDNRPRREGIESDIPSYVLRIGNCLADEPPRDQRHALNRRTRGRAFQQVRTVGGDESACTPDSVRDLAVRRWPSISAGDCPPAPAAYPGSNGRTTLPLLGLAPDGVYRATRVTPDAGALLPHRFTLTCAVDDCSPAAIGGLFSVALSCGSPRLGVTQHPVLRSPDVPRTDHPSCERVRTRPPGRLATAAIQPPWIAEGAGAARRR